MAPGRLLLHICCGPCTIYPLEVLREEKYIITGLFYNPNIHPYTEYLRRRDAVFSFAYGCSLDIQEVSGGDPRDFLSAIAPYEGNRCLGCYILRIRKTVEEAVKGGYDHFTTTLLFSLFQRHDLIRDICKEAAEEMGVTFIYRDFRVGWKKGKAAAKRVGMYRQSYCGCLFSEWERYGPTPGNGV